MDKQICSLTDRLIDEHLDRQMGRQAGRGIDGQTEMNRQTGEACRHTDMHSGKKANRAGRRTGL